MTHRFQTISVIGLGYIGLPTAAMFASRKHRVHGIDVNPHTVETINRGNIHIVEPDLDIVVRAAVSEGFLTAATAPSPADAFLIAVPTPFKGNDREPDLSYIEAACLSIAPVIKKNDLIVLESTSPVGTTEKMAEWLAKARPDLSFPQTAGASSDIRIAYCPERVLPGRVMQELIYNDRIIGGMTPACSAAAVDLYKIFVVSDCVVSNARTAEMAKLTENSFRDVNIAFANELSLICDRQNIDVWELIALANRHPRVNILQPGPGVGGHCIAVDPWFIVSSAPDLANLIRTARSVNDSKPIWVASRVREAVAQAKAKIADRPIVVACYGLTFKPDIDDIRESPALEILQQICSWHEGSILAVEPNIRELPVHLVERCAAVRLTDMEEAAGADVHVMLVDHTLFKKMPRPEGEIVDARGVWR